MNARLLQRASQVFNYALDNVAAYPRNANVALALGGCAPVQVSSRGVQTVLHPSMPTLSDAWGFPACEKDGCARSLDV